jgi:hypothetical protein
MLYSIVRCFFFENLFTLNNHTFTARDKHAANNIVHIPGGIWCIETHALFRILYTLYSMYYPLLVYQGCGTELTSIRIRIQHFSSIRIRTQLCFYYFFYNFLWPQAWSLNPLPEVYTLYGEGGVIRTGVS